MRYCLLIIFLLPVYLFSQKFEPIPSNVKRGYQFNLEKNFFTSEADFQQQVATLTTSLKLINASLTRHIINPINWVKLIQLYSKAESMYRVIDLYLFLRFAVDMNDVKADSQSDSIRNIMRTTRTFIKQKIAELPGGQIQQIIKTDATLAHYINNIRNEKSHLLNAAAEKLLAPYIYTRSGRFYDEAVSKMTFQKLKTTTGDIDVIKERSAWENNADTNVRRLGEKYIFDGFATQKDFIGYNYINFVKGLNAYAINKNFSGLADEKANEWQLSQTTLQSFFTHIIEGAKQKNKIPAIIENTSAVPRRFTITEASAKIENALGVLGADYKKELIELLNPANGRIDLYGNGNRIPIRGTASVYPIYPSIFYALNYEGHLIDLSLLAHEAGHAVQASLMYNNKVPMLYAAGPAYFTESFGKFNELLLFDYLARHEGDTIERKIYTKELKNRIDVIFGSTLEAFVEYSLIGGIVSGSIKTPEDLDSITQKSAASISPEIFTELPENKGLWLLLQTNYHAPLHNVNDMIASTLAIKYFQLYKAGTENFVTKYVALLKGGYNDTPANLLNKLGIAIEDENFIKSVVDFAVKN